jgi:glycosyltransferase involved in cell wall biosynthesis
LKIACISTSLVPSSTANSIQMMKVCQALTQVNGPVQVWVPGDNAAAWDDLAGHYGLMQPFEVHWLPSARVLRRYNFTWRALTEAQRWGAECIYTWMPQAALLGLQRGLPVILEAHDRISGRIGPLLFRQFVRKTGKKRLLVITQALLKKLEAQFTGLSALDIQIAPNGVELEQYENLPEAAAAREVLGLPKKLTAVYSGHFYAGRGVDLLVEMAAAFPQVSFVWAGGRPADIDRLRQRLHKQQIENVTLTGFIPNRRLPLYQAAGDILLMPYELSIAGSSGGNSAEICSPMKMFDYLAAGRAILTSDLAVFHEVLTHENAVFCQPEDVQSWQTALARLLNDPDLRHRLGTRARQDASNYAWRVRANKALSGFA